MGREAALRGQSSKLRFRVDVGQRDVEAHYWCGLTGTDRLGDVHGNEWRWWDHQDRGRALFTKVGQADGATSGFQGPKLQVDVGELAIWVMGADREAITRQEAALTVLRVMRAKRHVAGVDFKARRRARMLRS